MDYNIKRKKGMIIIEKYINTSWFNNIYWKSKNIDFKKEYNNRLNDAINNTIKSIDNLPKTNSDLLTFDINYKTYTKDINKIFDDKTNELEEKLKILKSIQETNLKKEKDTLLSIDSKWNDIINTFDIKINNLAKMMPNLEEEINNQKALIEKINKECESYIIDANSVVLGNKNDLIKNYEELKIEKETKLNEEEKNFELKTKEYNDLIDSFINNTPKKYKEIKTNQEQIFSEEEAYTEIIKINTIKQDNLKIEKTKIEDQIKKENRKFGNKYKALESIIKSEAKLKKSDNDLDKKLDKINSDIKLKENKIKEALKRLESLKQKKEKLNSSFDEYINNLDKNSYEYILIYTYNFKDDIKDKIINEHNSNVVKITSEYDIQIDNINSKIKDIELQEQTENLRIEKRKEEQEKIIVLNNNKKELEINLNNLKTKYNELLNNISLINNEKEDYILNHKNEFEREKELITANIENIENDKEIIELNESILNIKNFKDIFNDKLYFNINNQSNDLNQDIIDMGYKYITHHKRDDLSGFLDDNIIEELNERIDDDSFIKENFNKLDSNSYTYDILNLKNYLDYIEQDKIKYLNERCNSFKEEDEELKFHILLEDNNNIKDILISNDDTFKKEYESHHVLFNIGDKEYKDLEKELAKMIKADSYERYLYFDNIRKYAREYINGKDINSFNNYSSKIQGRIAFASNVIAYIDAYRYSNRG